MISVAERPNPLLKAGCLLFILGGLASLFCGVAAPVLFIIGGLQQNTAYNEAHTPLF